MGLAFSMAAVLPILLQTDSAAQSLPPEATKILVTLFLSFLIGLEREERKSANNLYAFGGIRTYPLIGLLGYGMAVLSGTQLLPLAVGFAVVAAFLWLSYQHKLQTATFVGVTTEMSGLTTFVVGALVSQGHFWIASALGVLSVLLLELKGFLEGLSTRIPAEEIFTFTKFLLLTMVILPIVPDQNLGRFEINPFKTWLAVVAVSTISYGSYLLQIFTKGKGGMILAALLGGAYSSTLTTVVMAKRSKDIDGAPHVFSGAILMASGVMYLRLAILIAAFNMALLRTIATPLLALSAIGLVAGFLWTRVPDKQPVEVKRQYVPRNPLEIWVALLFGAIFVAMLVLTKLVVTHLGARGVFGLAAVMGVTDVDPFVLSLTQSAGAVTGVALASAGILIATASNNAVKACYAYAFANRKTGVESLCLLLGFALLGIAPLIWLVGR
jgi:uncharacterized membrane protein (DUF4010 family)